MPDIEAPPPAASFQRFLPAQAPAQPAAPAALIAFSDPLPGYEVGSPFGLRQLPWEEAGRLHAGVDIQAPAGEPIRAAADGVVTRIGQEGGYGRFVEITHAEGLTTLYGHMGAFLPDLKTGDAVKAGQPVGKIGSTGTSTGAHLHFEVRDRKDRPLNPELFLGRSFAAAEDLPLREALRVPRRVRVAYVSMIPKSKQELMEAKRQAELEEKLAKAEALKTAKLARAGKLTPISQTTVDIPGAEAPATAADAAKDAGSVEPADGRVHSQLNF
ncbi:M23 family peptidase [Phenylobacterium deserti]|uniref:M23 family peptidase n=1 Tax=Phenylobacterium deserti TaxID=1914756 RepID=A0A328ATB7_9CAUL|nr:M23 family peptidase [Phenylobacterium deserti]